MDGRSDENLADACRRGDKNAYKVLVERYYRDIFAVCLGMLGNIHDAEDAAQETMLRGFLKIRKLRNGQLFSVWILRIARNFCIDLLRRQKHIKSMPVEESVPHLPTVSGNDSLNDNIRRLPQELRLPLVMYYFDNKNTETIAEKLNISRSGVCQRIRAARKLLHKLLTQGVHDEQ